MIKEEKLEQLNKLSRDYEYAQEREDLFMEQFAESRKEKTSGYFEMSMPCSDSRVSVFVGIEEACVLYDKLLEMLKEDRRKKYQAYAKLLDEYIKD